MLHTERVGALLGDMPRRTVVVLGDFFVDRYLLIDPARDEPSLETGLTAYQVTGERLSPGAAGNVAKNLRALGIGRVAALGAIGQDGEGWSLLRALARLGVDTQHLHAHEGRVTPTYIKPLRVQGAIQTEMNRLDRKNFTPMGADARAQLIGSLRALFAQADAILVVDQVVESECGVVGTAVRDELRTLARSRRDALVYVDSRAHGDQFRDVIVKCNAAEAVACINPAADPNDRAQLERCALALHTRNGRPVYITMGEQGMLVAAAGAVHALPGVPVQGPVDICGAGDAASAGIVAALCCGATAQEAAMMGNLAASIAIQKLNQTGEASPEELLQAARALERARQDA